MNTLRIALPRVEFLAADRVTDDTSILTLKSLVLEPLCTWRDGLAAPGLFSHWQHDATGRDWIFHIRPGACFHDGAACTAADILAFIAVIQQARDSFGMLWSYARYFAAVRFTEHTATAIRVQAPSAFADVLDVFTDFYLSRRDASGQSVIGTGPYRVADYQPNVAATLDRVAIDGTLPHRLLVQEVAVPQARLDLLRAGGADLATNLERRSAPPDFGPDLRWTKQTSTLSVMCYLQCHAGLFSNAAARRAVNHAVDKSWLVDEIFGGLAVPAATVVSPAHLGFSQSGATPIGFDRDAARRLLDRVDISAEITIRTPVYMPEKAPEISQAVQQALAGVGIAARLDVQPDRPDYAREIGRKQMGDMAMFDSSPHSTYRVLNDKISSGVRGIWWQGHDDPALEAMIAAANAAVQPAARAAAYGRCLARLNHNPPWLYLLHPVEVMAARHTAPPARLDPMGVLRLS